MCAVAIAIGWPMLRRTSYDLATRVALSWAGGLAALTVGVAVVANFGVAVRPVAIVVIAAALIALTRMERRLQPAIQGAPAEAGAPFGVSIVLPVAVFALDAWKIFKAPLWSWDHFAIWGAKARLLASSGALSSLRGAEHPEYPIGFPLAMHILSGGVMIDPQAVRIIHLAFLACVLLLVRGLVLLKTHSAVAADLTAAVAALLPLAWDTESLGLADVAIAAFALATSVLAVSADKRWVALALCAGFLPWLKHDALPLAILLLLLGARKEWRAVPLAAVIAFTSFAIWPGGEPEFFGGDWRFRFAYRFAKPSEVLLPIWGYLKIPAALGIWILTPIGLLIALLRRKWAAAGILTIVILQIATYCFVYFATNLDSTAHIDSSFHRIAAALAPLAVGALGITLSDDSLPR